MGLALLLAALACHGAEPAAGPESLTWQEANKRSAKLVREKGPSSEAADLARLAFDLYPQQAKRYDPVSHAQLLLNLAGVRHQAMGEADALREIDNGARAITEKAGSKTPVLIGVWQEGARIAGRGTREAARYSELAFARAEHLLGPDDPRTIELLLDVVHDRRSAQTHAWALAQLADARQRAAKSGEGSPLMTQIDLQRAKLHLENGQRAQAIEAYSSLIDRLEKRPDRDQDAYLQTAYAHLEYAYEDKGETALAAATKERRLERLRGDASALVPTLRTSPQYPRAAARNGTQGFVLFAMDINPDGTVADARVIDSNPPGVFDEVARKAILNWKFRPKVVDGQAVSSSGTQLIQFTLADDRGRSAKRRLHD